MWQDKLKEIIYILEHSEVNEIEVSVWGKKYRVVKSPPVIHMTGETLSTHPALSSIENPPDSGVSTAVEVGTEIKGETVLAPMPGTFYRSPAPNTDPFVVEGSAIKKGQALCIIEAMKIMNEIETETGGIIKQILVENGSPVEYNQPLFVIDPA